MNIQTTKTLVTVQCLYLYSSCPFPENQCHNLLLVGMFDIVYRKLKKKKLQDVFSRVLNIKHYIILTIYKSALSAQWKNVKHLGLGPYSKD